MHNIITIKTKNTEIGIGGPTGWYLDTTIGRHRIERYRDIDGQVVWARTDMEKEKRGRLEMLRNLLVNDPQELGGIFLDDADLAALGVSREDCERLQRAYHGALEEERTALDEQQAA